MMISDGIKYIVTPETESIIKTKEAVQEEEAHLEAIWLNEAFVPKIRAWDDGK